MTRIPSPNTGALSLLFSLAQCQQIITSNFNCKPDGCCDQHQFCQFWADSNQCHDNVDWMKPNCQIACQTCGLGDFDEDKLMPPPASLPNGDEFKPDNKQRDVRQTGCVDMDRFQCPIWASRGECRINPRWMTPNCAVSCGTCNFQMQLRRRQPQRQQQQFQQQRQQPQQQQQVQRQPQQPQTRPQQTGSFLTVVCVLLKKNLSSPWFWH